MRKKGPSADMTEVGRPNTHSVLEIVGGRLALRPRRRGHGIRGDPHAIALLRELRSPRRGFPRTPAPTSSPIGASHRSGTIGRGGTHFFLLPITQPHSATEINRGPSQLPGS